MARLVTEGFELLARGTSHARKWFSDSLFVRQAYFPATPPGPDARSPGVLRIESYYSDHWFVITPRRELAEFYLRCAFYQKPYSTNEHAKGGVNLTTRTNTSPCRITLVPSGGLYRVALKSGATVLAQSDAIVEAERWYLLTAHALIGTSGSVTIKLDGSTVVEYTGNLGTVPIYALTCYSFSGAGGAYTFWDDFALNDTSGTADNSWPPDGRILGTFPSENGYYAQWAYSGASSAPLACNYGSFTWNRFIHAWEHGVKHTFTHGLQIGPEYEVRLVELRASLSGIDLQGPHVRGLLRSDNSDYTGTAVQSSRELSPKTILRLYRSPFTNLQWSRGEIANLEFGLELV